METYYNKTFKTIFITTLISLFLPVLLLADAPVFKDDFLVLDTTVGTNWVIYFPQVSLGGNNKITSVNMYDTLPSPWEQYLLKGFNQFDLNGNEIQPYVIYTPFVVNDTIKYVGTLSIPHSNENGYTLFPTKASTQEQFVFIVDSTGQIVHSPKCLNCDNPFLNNHYNEIGYGAINNNTRVGLVWYAFNDIQVSPTLYEDSVFVRLYDFETDSLSPLLNPLSLPLPEIDEPGYLGDYKLYAKPKMAIADDGSFVVAWVVLGEDFRHLFYVVYNADYTPRSEVQMADCSQNWSDSSSCSAAEANNIDVAMESDGDFYICWNVFQRTPYADVRNHVWVRGFNADGSPKYDPVRVNDSDSLWMLLGDEFRPNVDCDDDGNVLVSWDDARDYPGNYQPKDRNIYVQRVDPNGNLVGFNTRVNNVDGAHKSLWHSLSLINSGQALISWRNDVASLPPVAAQLMPYDMIGTFVPGDLNYDRSADITDLIDLVEYMFGGAINSFWPRSLTDVNASGATNISDLVYLVSYIFIGGPAPITPDEGIRPNPGKFNLGG